MSLRESAPLIDQLGALPEPDAWRARGNLFSLAAVLKQGWADHAEGVFTAEQMRAYAAGQVAAERERCAALCEGLANVIDASSTGKSREAGMSAARSCAGLIRGA